MKSCVLELFLMFLSPGQPYGGSQIAKMSTVGQAICKKASTPPLEHSWFLLDVKAQLIPEVFPQQPSFDKAICSVKVIALIDSQSITSAMYVYTYMSICRIPDANRYKQFPVFLVSWFICHTFDTLKIFEKSVLCLEVDKINKRKGKQHYMLLFVC